MGDIGTVWRSFCGEYMAGTIYPVTYPTVKDIIAIPENWQKVVMDASLKEMKWDAPDLSAIVYRVQLNKQWSAATSLNVRLTDPGGGGNVQVYGFRNSPRAYSLLGGGRASVLIENADTLAQSNTVLYVMVSNGRAVSPYTGTTPITVTFEIPNFLPTLRLANYVQAAIEAAPICSAGAVTCPSFLSAGNSYSIKPQDPPLPFTPAAWQTNFSVTGKTTTTNNYGTNEESIDVSVEFNDTGSVLKRLVADISWTYSYKTGDGKSHVEVQRTKFTIEGLPHTSPAKPGTSAYHTFTATGTNAAPYLTSYSWSFTFDDVVKSTVTGFDWTRSLAAEGKGAARQTGAPGIFVTFNKN